MTKFITSKTHYYIAVRWHLSPYKMNLWPKRKDIHMEWNAYLSECNQFTDELSLRFLGISTLDFYKKNLAWGIECFYEELHERTGVLMANAEANHIFCIPKTEIGLEVYNWILANCKVKYKILKKTRGTYMDSGVQTLHRDMAKKSADSIRQRLEEK